MNTDPHFVNIATGTVAGLVANRIITRFLADKAAQPFNAGINMTLNNQNWDEEVEPKDEALADNEIEDHSKRYRYGVAIAETVSVIIGAVVTGLAFTHSTPNILTDIGSAYTLTQVGGAFRDLRLATRKNSDPNPQIDNK